MSLPRLVPEAVGHPEPVTLRRGHLLARRLRRSPGAALGAGMLAVAAVFAAVANAPNPWRHDEHDLLHLGVAPGVGGHWLGTTGGGGDLWAMLVHGTGRSLLVAAVVGVATPVLGGVYGATIGYWGGRRERAGMWVLDMLILLPSFLLVAVIMGSGGTGPGGPLTLALLLTGFGWMGIARVVRAQTASLREREFVRAARYLGARDAAIIRRHLLPNLASFLVLSVVLATLSAIVTETALSYLGVGIRPPDVSLGQLLAAGAEQVSAYPWLFWAPVGALVWITVGLALLGDGLRDALDPRGRAMGRA